MGTNLFGAGFIGRKYKEMFPETIVLNRDTLVSTHPEVLYMISTIHNYHPKDGNPFIDIETNNLHFMKVLDECVKKHGGNLVFNLVSTWFVYGHTDYPAKEDSECRPTGFYSITARARELLLQSYAELKGFKYRILRLGGVIGVGDKKASAKKNALQWMVKTVAQGGTAKIYEGDALRDFIDVRDCARAINLVITEGKTNEIYNIANGQGLRVSTLVEHANQVGGFMGQVGRMPVPDFHKSVQVTSMWLDVKKLKDLGYVQQHDIKTSVAELVHYYQTHDE